MNRRDIGRVWDFLKLSFREVNVETVEYQRPRSKHRFEEIFEEEGIEQLVFEVDGYQSLEAAVRLDQNIKLDVTLVKKPPAAVLPANLRRPPRPNNNKVNDNDPLPLE